MDVSEKINDLLILKSGNFKISMGHSNPKPKRYPDFSPKPFCIVKAISPKIYLFYYFIIFFYQLSSIL
jgi:hypothetical protein